jgi:ABC-2 type transport system ATP-binding protein
MDEAEHCHRLAFIQRGEIIAYGSPAEIKRDMMRGQVLEIAPSNPERAVEVLRKAKETRKLPLDEVEMYGSLIHLVATDMDEHINAIEAELSEANIQSGQISIVEPSLEDVFIACMR